MLFKNYLITRRIIICLCTSVFTVCNSAELVIRDLVIDADFLPTTYDYTLTDSAGERSGSDEFDSALGILVGGRYSFAGPGDSHGFIIGGELAAAQYGTSNPTGHFTTYGARVEGGYGYAISDSWTISGLVDIGYALATYDITGGTAFPSFSASGSTLSYGLALGVDYAITEKVLVGLDLGYQIRSADLSGSGIDLQMEQSGMRFALGLTYRFSARPSPLE